MPSLFVIGQSAKEFSSEVVDAGINTMETFFRKWSSADNQANGDEDVNMEDDDEAQLNNLKKHINELRPLIQENPWLQSVITAL